MPKPKDKRRASGNYFQNWCEKFILKNFPGSHVHNQKAYSKSYRNVSDGKTMWFSVRNDLWGCIDLAVILPHTQPMWKFAPPGKPLFIQATAWSHVTDKLDKIAVVPWDLSHVTVQLWQKREPGRVTIKQLFKNEDGFYLKDVGEIKRGKYTEILEKQ